MRSYHTRPTNPVPTWRVWLNVALGLLCFAAWGYIFGLAYLTGLY